LKPTTLFGDNQYQFIHEAIEDGTVKLVYFPMNNMVVDILAKALPHDKI